MYDTYMTTKQILVTGSLGNIGREVINGLVAAGAPVRAADLNALAVQDAFGDSVTPVAFNFTEPSTWASTFADIDIMFLMRPPALSNIERDMAPALEAAKATGVKHIVFLSLQGAENNKVVPHAKVEDWLTASGLKWTFIRPSFFMENLSTTHRTDITDRNDIFVPAGKGKTAFVAASDVAAVSVVALLNPADHEMTSWTPTGPESLTYGQVAAILSGVLGRKITYAKPGAIRYALHAKKELGMPWAMVGVTTAIYTIARLGKADGLTNDVVTVTGKEPVSFKQWAEENKQVWL